jgi:hypothetical protein
VESSGAQILGVILSLPPVMPVAYDIRRELLRLKLVLDQLQLHHAVQNVPLTHDRLSSNDKPFLSWSICCPACAVQGFASENSQGEGKLYAGIGRCLSARREVGLPQEGHFIDVREGATVALHEIELDLFKDSSHILGSRRGSRQLQWWEGT